MSIERKHTIERMSQIVTHGDTVYLAGQVAAARSAIERDPELVPRRSARWPKSSGSNPISPWRPGRRGGAPQRNSVDPRG